MARTVCRIVCLLGLGLLAVVLRSTWLQRERQAATPPTIRVNESGIMTERASARSTDSSTFRATHRSNSPYPMVKPR